LTTVVLAGSAFPGYGARKRRGAPMKRYIVKLSEEEKKDLHALTH
jgi:hypothetical protein